MRLRLILDRRGCALAFARVKSYSEYEPGSPEGCIMDAMPVVGLSNSRPPALLC